MTVSTFTYLNQVQIGSHSLKRLAEICHQFKIEHPLVVTDPGVRAAGLLDRLAAILKVAGMPFTVFAETPSNPTELAVREATTLYALKGCDGLIALGGGSAIDCAKGVAILATHPGELKTYATIEGGSPLITAVVPPVIAIPTTAGTGSEVARGAILIVDDGRKLGFHSWHLVPKVALLDPELTVGLPPLLTAATGMDAITHCMETYISAAINPAADGMALEGLNRGWHSIVEATQNGTNREARLNMLSASMLGAMAFQKGLGCVHSLSHSLGGLNARLHHGTLNALFLPAVLGFNSQAESVRREARMDRLANVMGLSSGSDVPFAVKDMNRRLGLPEGLSQVGVGVDQFDSIIEGAMRDHCHPTNPREATVDDYRELLRQSL